MGLALVLLVGAALFIRTLVALHAVDPGFDSRRVLTMRMSLTGARFEKTSAVAQVIREGTERVNALAGVEVAGAACCVPLQGGLGLPFTIEGRPLTQGAFHGGGGFIPISATYFSAFKIPILRGRAFTDRDDGGAPGVVIINQTMAKQFWPDGDPLADRITISKGVGPQFDEPPRQIVGIVGDVRANGLGQEPGPTFYVPWAQLPDLHNANLTQITPLAWFVRARGEAYSVSASVQEALREASGGLPVARPRSMDEVVARSTARSDFNMLLLTVFAGSALLLAAIGIYGLMAYSVEQRTQEIKHSSGIGCRCTSSPEHDHLSRHGRCVDGSSPRPRLGHGPHMRHCQLAVRRHGSRSDRLCHGSSDPHPRCARRCLAACPSRGPRRSGNCAARGIAEWARVSTRPCSLRVS
jgi:putative ABC transport system permease protein